MKITGLQIDGYGIWTGLKLEGLCDGLSVLYGPNEAGKTTLLQFIRSALYGFAPARRRYLPPVRGGCPGGSIDLAGPSGRFRLQRRGGMTAEGENGDRPALIAADGTRQGEHLIKVLLGDVDEAIYNNIFAVGLREMQQLATLSDTQAAELLYRLTAGLDRVSLVEVIEELETSRNRILDARRGPCQVAELLDRRQQLRLQIEQSGKLTRRYARLAAEQNQLQRELTRLEGENDQIEYQARVVELAISLRERWQRRAALDDQLAALRPPATVPEGAVQRLDGINARLEQHQQHADQAQRQLDGLRAEAAGLGTAEPLGRQAARIEALQDQRPWIDALRRQISALEAETTQLRADLAAEQQRLGLGDQSGSDVAPTISAGLLATLRPAAGQVKRCRRRLKQAQRKAATANRQAETLSRRITTALSNRDPDDLAAAIDRTGNLLSQLRRRAQIDQRVDRMTLYQAELEEGSRRLIDHQLLPAWVLLALGAVFVLGVVLVMAGLFMPATITGPLGWAMALLGLAGGGAAGLGKVMLERSNTRQLETCQKQLNLLQLQLRQANEERETLDRQLPGGGGPIASRLEAAQEELAALEELAPLDARRAEAQQQAQAAAARVAQAEEQLAAALRRWREGLAGAGLPDSVAPKQVRPTIHRCEQIGQMHRRLADRREQLERHRRELEALVGRIAQLARQTGVAPASDDPTEQLDRLAASVRQQEACFERREVLRRQARRLRRKRAKHQEAISRLGRHRRRLLRQADAPDEQQFRQRVVQLARAEVLRQERDALTREIAAAVGGQCSEDDVGRQLQGQASESLQSRRDELLERLAALEKDLTQRFEQRGRLAEQLKCLAEDRQMAAKQLELAMVDKRLEGAIGRWQVLAVTRRILETIRATYEKQRQPETLQEASGYLKRLTQGRYRRVWTPLGEDVLRVEDARGSSLPVEVLSRGAREQLFLSLRLALAACYARRGAPLPLVLDDVLVNFDAARAKAAAAVLRDFAAAGHQVLVFTCHEHILKLFKALKVPISQLPDNAQTDPSPITFEQPPKKRTRRSTPGDPSPARPSRGAYPVPLRPQGPKAEHEPPSDEIPEAEDGPVRDEIRGHAAREPDLFEPPVEDMLWSEEDLAEVKAIEPEADADEYEVDGEEENGYDEQDEFGWDEADDPEADNEAGEFDDPYEDDDTAEAA